MDWIIALLVVSAAAGVYALHRLASWAEGRGWIYYRRRRGSSGTLSSAVLEVQSILEPSRRYVLEEKRCERVEEDDRGEPPGTEGGTSARPSNRLSAREGRGG